MGTRLSPLGKETSQAADQVFNQLAGQGRATWGLCLLYGVWGLGSSCSCACVWNHRAQSRGAYRWL